MAAVHAPRATTTERAASRPTAVMQDHVHLAIGDQDTFDVQRLEMREQVSDAQTGASDARAVRHARRQQGLPEWPPGARNWRLSHFAMARDTWSAGRDAAPLGEVDGDLAMVLHLL